jgi:hypothetical protein
LPQAVSVTNGEEGAYPGYPFQANHSKALPKLNGAGRSDANPDAYRFYRDILEEARRGPGRRFDEIPLGGTRTRRDATRASAMTGCGRGA